ncbi:glycoside hydrolase family 24 protein [Stenotrophomonas maltophilia]|uniref:glycoside hydrolase family 24 protein n=1 Tax=Stenotrophomonas maltophilia TaxID=40324 RepID=UPI0015DE35F9|nr:glycoside hydrolase family 104 protein [Stenotrophomonas maltophilia]MBA0416174.1 lysozyme [Stenotrophomonas maltophilia]MBH1749311.1 glycoside hydrolase family 104 protein [Stenotrophomonas maltophilia]
MARITAQEAGGQNVVAFLDMLAWSEGTDNGRQPTKQNGYDVLVGGGLFTDLSKHPAKLVRLNPKLASTAAGRYQFLSRTWGALQKQLGLPNFGPLSQDKACIELIRGRRALDAVKAGQFDRAVALCSKEWASLPGAGYGQHEQSLEKLRSVYQKAGGKVGGSA